MPVNDPIADMLVRIRNAANAKFDQVSIPHSRIKESIARVMVDEGFLRGLEVVGADPRKVLVVDLKYAEGRRPAFVEMHRVSRLGRRVYVAAEDIRPNRQGVGVAILSTSKGVLKDVEAKRQNVGGEVLCTIW